MGTPRRKNLVSSRRRVDDDGEEEGSVVAGMEDDSLSEGSIISDADDDADAEGSDASDADVLRRRVTTKSRSDHENHLEVANGKVQGPSEIKKPSSTAATADTEIMMNGLRISGDVDEGNEIHFDNIRQQQEASSARSISAQNPTGSIRSETIAERRKREHEEYRKKRDADPAFVPNRGGFFMHDHRSAASGQNGLRPFGRGRGRGRGNNGGPFSPISQPSQTSGSTDAPWAHDLHESVAQLETGKPELTAPEPNYIPPEQQKPVHPISRVSPPNRSFSKSTRIGNIQIRVYLTGMQDPIIFSAVPVNQHTRLPHHRPPLRRDKPVRISIPNCPPRYIFPAMDRSFIFIPRALRPNQQGFGRGRGRGSFSGYNGFPGRRTSAYGGSIYSPSVAMSRRSSLAREASREGIISPAGSTMSRPQGAVMEIGKPVVRLPPAIDQAQAVNQQTQDLNGIAPIVNLPQVQSYALPQKPLSRENRTATLPMHQPRPQKTVSVADIESPATLNFHPPQQQQQQPFHHQVPPQVNGQAYQADPSLFLHSRHPSHPSQASGGTPLSQIPERAIHAQPFQPFPYHQPPGFYQQQYPPPVYFYPPPPPPAVAPSVAAPTFIPGQQYPYMIANVPPVPPVPDSAAQSGTVAHESNGMVYYYDSSQLAANSETPTSFAPAVYPPPGGFLYPQPATFFPPQ